MAESCHDSERPQELLFFLLNYCYECKNVIGNHCSCCLVGTFKKLRCYWQNDTFAEKQRSVVCLDFHFSLHSTERAPLSVNREKLHLRKWIQTHRRFHELREIFKVLLSLDIIRRRFSYSCGASINELFSISKILQEC